MLGALTHLAGIHEGGEGGGDRMGVGHALRGSVRALGEAHLLAV